MNTANLPNAALASAHPGAYVFVSWTQGYSLYLGEHRAACVCPNCKRAAERAIADAAAKVERAYWDAIRAAERAEWEESRARWNASPERTALLARAAIEGTL